jgi:hypothetical protein
MASKGFRTSVKSFADVSADMKAIDRYIRTLNKTLALAARKAKSRKLGGKVPPPPPPSWP